jgi:choline-sulfatase
MADQLNPNVLSAYGNKISQTPNIDLLAKQGVVFDSAYCNSPLCAPSRYAFLTGQLPSTIGAFDNASELAAEAPTFAHYLRDAGYRTILAGKMHFCGADQQHGFEERLTTDIYPADFGWTPDWSQPEQRLDWYHNMSSVTQAGTCVRSNQLDFDDEVVFSTRQKLYDLARENDPRPFCLVASLTHPHDPFAVPQSYWNRYNTSDIPTPSVPNYIADAHADRIRAMCLLDDQTLTTQQIQRARHAYYAAVSYVDDQFGTIMETLRECGQAEETIVIVVSDHGDMLGERGLWYKMNFFEGSSRVPLIVHAPQRYAAHRVAQSVSLVDLLPTLLDIGADGALPCETLAGQSLLPHLIGNAGHDQVFAEYLAEGALAPIVMIRRGPWKFIHSPADPDQLYDLSQDPHELHNLAPLPKHAAMLDCLRAETARRWNLAELHQTIVQSQQRRRLVFRALQQGINTSWDFQPRQDAAQRYIRNHLKLDDLEARARFPKAEISI